MKNGFLPISKKDIIEQGIEQLDFVYITGQCHHRKGSAAEI